TKDPRFTAGWIWGMSQMRALTAALTEPEVFQPEKVLTTGGSKRGVASALAGIHDDRFTAIMPVVAPPLGDPGSSVHVLGSGPAHLGKIDERFFADLAAGKLDLPDSAEEALKDRGGRRAAVRLTLEQARQAGWTDADIARVNATVWNGSRITDFLPALRERGLAIFYNVGCNDSVTPALRQLGERFPDFPICIIPGGQHGGPKDAGFTRRVPLMEEVQDNFLSFARSHFFADRGMIQAPVISGDWDASSRTQNATIHFVDGSEPQKNELWWNVNRSEPYTLPFEYDEWNSVALKRVGEGKFAGTVRLESEPERLDFISLHTHTENDLPLTVSSPYRRIEPAKPAGYDYRKPTIPHGSRLVFIGDSITDMKWGRNEKDRNHYLGHSFVYLIASRLGADLPEAKLEFFNRGKSGNRVSDLKARWKQDAIEMNPDILTILIGVNDVSRGRGQPVALKQWEADYREILAQSRKANPDLRIVLLDPFVLRSGRLKPDATWKFWRGEIDKQRAVVSRLAKEFDAVHIKTQDVFDRAAKQVSPGHWIWDGVHPLPQGHELMAREWIERVSRR
ncbi:MAG: GDSL-type esterase/lipase family protein, partial [Limisphaerales bacterium]